MPRDEVTEARRLSFGKIAESYDRFRPGPPAEAVDWALGTPVGDVLELGAGTGGLTRELVGRAAHVLAVEPDDRMRAILSDRVPRADVVAGQGEAIPADDASVDAVIASSSWHWVDEERAVPEVARVLRPGRTFALLWSGPDRTIEWMRSLWAGGTSVSDDQKEASDAQRRKRHVVHLGSDAPFAEPQRRVVEWTAFMTKEELLGLACTYSIVITMSDADRRLRLEAMRAFLDQQEELAGRDVIDVPMRCLCWRTVRE